MIHFVSRGGGQSLRWGGGIHCSFKTGKLENEGEQGGCAETVSGTLARRVMHWGIKGGGGVLEKESVNER